MPRISPINHSYLSPKEIEARREEGARREGKLGKVRKQNNRDIIPGIPGR